MLRSFPWQERTALLKQHQRYENLLEFHTITQSWLSPLAISKTRRKNQDFHTLLNRPLVNSTGIDFPSLDSLLDDTSPEELLDRLEQSVWEVHLEQVQVRLSSTTENSGLQTLLKSFFDSGAQFAARRWNVLKEGNPSRQDLRALLFLATNSPLSSRGGEQNFLIRKNLSHEIEFELLACPHLSHFCKKSDSLDSLCALHSEWMRGFLQTMNPRAEFHYTALNRSQSAGKCRQRWSLRPADR